eukprot:CAMPEP_0172729128 /NCGR_PEP_ID=MMETSP1074-20121228/93816_1 /TAXON_ID=2916 /ORGANISM="Ceratium fusus, Strain PA161109" /LENGTH=268 /DNA_ID=CAMNT_0013556529 /DNA_START=51 /DNA_END=857 /DNA_ORIENTATION=+
MKASMLVVSFVVALIAIESQVGFLKATIAPFAREWPHSSVLHLVNYFGMLAMPLQVRLLEHVLQNAKPGNAEDIVEKVDEFCWKNPTMNVGPVKGKIVDEALASMDSSPKVVVEFGSYMGYSTVRLASLLRKTAPDAVLYSVDPNPLGHAIKTTLLEWAGLLGPNVKNELAYSGDILKKLAAEGKKIDFLFLDHVKELYLEDAKVAEQLQLLKTGSSLVVADNVIAPGAPEYRAWMMENKQFDTKIHTTLLEYTHDTRDEVLVSKYLR